MIVKIELEKTSYGWLGIVSEAISGSSTSMGGVTKLDLWQYIGAWLGVDIEEDTD